MLSSMNRLELAASILIVTLPLAAQTPATPAAHPAATITAPPAGFAQTIVLWPDSRTSKGDSIRFVPLVTKFYRAYPTQRSIDIRDVLYEAAKGLSVAQIHEHFLRSNLR
jgi:hypothetical protein